MDISNSGLCFLLNENYLHLIYTSLAVEVDVDRDIDSMKRNKNIRRNEANAGLSVLCYLRIVVFCDSLICPCLLQKSGRMHRPEHKKGKKRKSQLKILHLIVSPSSTFPPPPETFIESINFSFAMYVCCRKTADSMLKK